MIIQHLSPDFQYDSQWVFESLNYSQYIDYIRGKFKTLKDKEIKIGVEIVDDTYMGGKMLRLLQSGQSVFYRIVIKDGKVIKGDMCMF